MKKSILILIILTSYLFSQPYKIRVDSIKVDHKIYLPVGGLEDSTVQLSDFTTAAYNFIGAGGAVTNNPDDVTLENKAGETIGITHDYLVDTVGSSINDTLTSDRNHNIDITGGNNLRLFETTEGGANTAHNGSRILVCDTLTNLQTGGHSFEDATVINTVSSSQGFASIDIATQMIGSNANDHYIGIQYRPTYSASVDLIGGYAYGYRGAFTHSGTGVIDRFAYNYFSRPAGSGEIENCYGMFMGDFNGRGSEHSYAMYVEGGTVFFRDSLVLGYSGNFPEPQGILDIANEYYFPSVDGIFGQTLTTDGANKVSWVTPGSTSLESNSLPSPYYNFLGNDDYITPTDETELYNEIGTASFRFRTGDDVTTSQYIVFGAFPRFYLRVTGSDFTLILGDNLLNQFFTDAVLPNTWYDVTIVWDNAVGGGSGDATCYVNGVEGNGTTTYTGFTSMPANLVFGASSSAFNGSYSRIRFYNDTLTINEINDLRAGAVPYKWTGANNTELTSGTLTVGKEYRITDWITGDDFTNVGGTNEDGCEFVATGTTPTTWTNSSTVMPIGCVLEYDASTMKGSTWYDKSGNGNNGTVTGATLQNVSPAINQIGTDSASDDDYIVTLPGVSNYYTGLQIVFTAAHTNTGACTVNVNGLGAKSLKAFHDQDPPTSYIESQSIVVAIYDGTNFQMIQPDANP